MSAKINRAARMREMLQITQELGNGGALVRAGDVISEAIRRIPLEDVELELLSNGKPRGEVNARWSSRELVEAGWLQKDPDGSSWTATEAGIAALRDHPEIADFANQSRRLSTEWRTNRKVVRSEQLSTVILPLNDDQA